MADEIKINGHNFLIGRMAVMDKFHVARRLGPVLSGLMKSAAPGAAPGDMMAGIAAAVAAIPQDDADFVINHCLAVTKYVQDGRPFPVMRNDMMMYDFIDLPDMMQIVFAVLQENLGAFFPVGPSTSTAEASPSPSTSSLSPTA